MSADLVARGLAAASARSNNTAALVNAVRSNGFFPAPTARLVANDTPVVLIGTANAASTINANPVGNPTLLASDSRLRWLSGPTTLDGSATWTPRGAWYGAGRIAQ